MYQSTIIEAVLSQWLCVTIPNECTKMKKSVCLHEKLENVEWESTSVGIIIEENNISG